MPEDKEFLSIEHEGKSYQEVDCSKCHKPSWRLFNNGPQYLAKCQCGHKALIGGGSQPQGNAFKSNLKDVL